jgi:type I restriction enzyme, R subunit
MDECHRGSASEDAAWRKVLDYFSSATQIGMTATPKKLSTSPTSSILATPCIPTLSGKESMTDSLRPTKWCALGSRRTLTVGVLRGARSIGPVKRSKDREYNDLDFDRNLILKRRGVSCDWLERPAEIRKRI